MNKRTAGCAAGFCAVAMAFVQVVYAAKSTPPAPAAGGQQVPTNEDELRAVDTARLAVSRLLYVSADALPVLTIEKRSWPNTGLGCASEDDATIRIPRNGYAIVLATPVGPRRVHVAGRSAKLCEPSTTQTALLAGETVLPYDLSAMVEHARTDLARRLDTPLSAVRLVSFTPVEWLDSTMECAVPYEVTQRKRIKGYQLQLSHGERMYVYHTDLVRTRACPASGPAR